VRSDVNAILFDEPLTVIDPHMKWVLRSQLKQLHRQFGYTMIYVTHDQTEALTFADKVVVMYDGQIVQIGTPAELFERPKHTFVGYFIGSPGMNVLPAAVEGAGAHRRQTSPASARAAYRPRPRARATELGIRPEFMPLGALGMPVHHPQGRGYRPPPGRARRDSAGQPLTASCPRTSEIPADPRVASIPPGSTSTPTWRVEGGRPTMEKTWNNKAWFMVLPVLVLVAFSAVIPLMTVVNYSVQDTFGNNEFFWAGTEWFEEMLDSDRFWEALGRNLLFSGIILAIEIPLGIFIALNMPKKGWGCRSASC
jgi:hypothetical protein